MNQTQPVRATSPAASAIALRPRQASNAQRAWRRFMATRLAGLSLLVLVLTIAVAIAAPIVAPYDPVKQDFRVILKPPSSAHLLGTDDIGRDILSRIIYGSRVSLQVGATAVIVAVGMGLLLGLAAGFLGGWIDEVIMRAMDALWSFPGIILALAIATVLGPSQFNAALAIGVVSTPGLTRLARAQTLVVRELEYVTAARTIGASPLRIITRHVMPNMLGPIIVQASLMLGGAIEAEATLSFLGFGVRPPTPSWGSMIQTGYGVITSGPWFSLAPGFVLFLVVVSCNLIGDGLRAALDPRQLQGKG